MSSPAGDLGITIEVAAALVAAQFPDGSGSALAPFAHGWDNETFSLGANLLVRIPRRQVAVRLIRNEQRWLPTLAPLVPVAVPEPVHCGRPSADFPHPWSIVPRLPGTELAALSLDHRSAAADDLADVLVALHRPAPRDAPRNEFRGVPLAHRRSAIATRLAALPGLDPRLDDRWLAWNAAAPYSGPPVWLHGDLHPRNLLVDSDGRLSAVLDWGDVTAGDPASDLATAWLAFGAPDRERFVRRYQRGTRCDESTWTRARAWALALATAFLHARDPLLAPVARHALADLLAD